MNLELEGPAPAKRVRRRALWTLLALGCGALAVSSFAFKTRSEPALAPRQRDVPYLDGDYIRYSSGFAERNRLKFAPVQSGALYPVIHVTGTVDFDPNRVAAIGARIPGRVRSVRALEGDRVERGDVLAEIESAELGEAQAAVISARARVVAANANDKREKALAEAKISSVREAELASAQAAAARAELMAAEGRVRAMGGRPRGEPGILLLQSPLAGRVVKRELSRGQFVEPTLTAFKVADLSRVFIELAVFERDVVGVRQGDRVEVFSSNSPRAPVEGRVAHVGEEIDLQTKTAGVRVVVDQPAIPLRPGQSVLAKIHSSAPTGTTIVVPRSAVTSVDGKSTVFIDHGDRSVEPRSVELGRQDGEHTQVLQGLREGERLAVNGVFALKSEIFR
jgi:membrane fusion protein, heavy metal efflux system